MKFHWRNLAANNLAVVFMFKILQYIKCRKPKENEDDNKQTVTKYLFLFVLTCSLGSTVFRGPYRVASSRPTHS